MNQPLEVFIRKAQQFCMGSGIDEMSLSRETAEAALAKVTDSELWSLRYSLKRNLIDFIDRSSHA